jgi:hypothetical protein
MKQFPTSEALAAMVSTVTETMFGLSFRMSDSFGAGKPWGSPWRMAVLPVKGAQPITVAIASDRDGGAALGSAMFACPAAQCDESMINDSLSELVNIVAGQVKTSMGLDSALGLPRILEQDKITVDFNAWHSATLHNKGQSVVVWVAITSEQV